MLDADLAELYDVPTKAFNQAIQRNMDRFPEDFMFQLTEEEFAGLRSQFVTSKKGRGGRRYLPYVFTEQGVAMLSGVLNSHRAVQVNIAIMRAFVRMRRMLVSQDVNLGPSVWDTRRSSAIHAFESRKFRIWKKNLASFSDSENRLANDCLRFLQSNPANVEANRSDYGLDFGGGPPYIMESIFP
jgi:hypothetical protein